MSSIYFDIGYLNQALINTVIDHLPGCGFKKLTSGIENLRRKPFEVVKTVCISFSDCTYNLFCRSLHATNHAHIKIFKTVSFVRLSSFQKEKR